MPRPAPSSSLFFALLGALALAIAGWSLFWFTARQAAVATLAGVDEALAKEGWQRTCTAEGWGGYPFRLGFSCTGLTLKGPDTTLTLPQVSATMQVHDPATVIVTAAAPLVAATPEGMRTVGFEAARAALRLANPAALAVETRLTAPSLTIENGPVLTASALDVTVRPAPEAVAVTLALAAPAVTAPLELRADRIMVAGELKPPPPPAPTAAEFLRQAGAQRTALDLESFAVEGEGFALSGSGTLALTPDGFVDGKVRVEATGPGAVANRLKDAGALPEGDRGLDALAAMLSAIGSTALTVSVKNGHVSVGPFKLGRLPPVF